MVRSYSVLVSLSVPLRYFTDEVATLNNGHMLDKDGLEALDCIFSNVINTLFNVEDDCNHLIKNAVSVIEYLGFDSVTARTIYDTLTTSIINVILECVPDLKKDIPFNKCKFNMIRRDSLLIIIEDTYAKQTNGHTTRLY